jgi:glycosyltransferase involved in cell wall biosynthesis
VVQERRRRAIIRLACTLIASRHWTGGYNYLLNAVRALDAHGAHRITPLIFAGDDVPEEDLAPFREIRSVEVVRSETFDRAAARRRLARSMLWGIDRAVAPIFQAHGVDVAFESATFYGWRFPLPAIAWIPDFQHRHLRDLFSVGEYWKRELGFRAQVASGRTIMVSSEDARQDCERFYTSSTTRIAVVRFAVLLDPASLLSDPAQAVQRYGLPERFFYLPNQFWKHKNHRLVIDALCTLKQRGHDDVVVAASGTSDPRFSHHYHELQSLVAARGLAKNFYFLGMVPRHDVVALMRACTAVINPSLFEGWSTTVEEARILGVPMLLSDLRVHREQVGDSAVFFDPNSAEELAARLAEYPQASKSSRCEAEHSALDLSRRRVSQFALDFADAVQFASQGSHA